MEPRKNPADSLDISSPPDAIAIPQPSMLLAILAVSATIGVTLLMVATRARFEQMISEFELPLSPVTSFALGPVLPIMLGFIGVVTIAKEFLRPLKPFANVWNGSVLCFAIGCLGIYTVGIFQPLMALVKGLS
jgi:hypothetical protein